MLSYIPCESSVVLQCIVGQHAIAFKTGRPAREKLVLMVLSSDEKVRNLSVVPEYKRYEKVQA